MSAETGGSSLAALAGRINIEHERALAAAPWGLKHARAAGDALMQARALCPRRSWTSWLRANVTVSVRKAYDYMRVARNWPLVQANARGRNALTLDNALLLLMGLPSTPVRGTKPDRAHRRKNSA
jgi:hypothetical protein